MPKLPGVFWVALILGVNEALQTLDLSTAPAWVSVGVFVVAAVAKALQEARRTDEITTAENKSFIVRVLF